MKPIFTAPILVFIFIGALTFKAYSQDWILLSSGDTVKCTITKTNDKYIYFSQNKNGLSANGKVLKTNAVEWRCKPQHAEINDSVEVEKPEKSKKVYVAERFRASLQGGVGGLIGNTDAAENDLISKGASKEEAESYYNDLITGYQGSASMYYRIAKELWLGGNYKGFATSSSITTSLHIDDVQLYHGEVSEHMFVNFAGASIFSSVLFGKAKRFAVNSAFTIGPAFYRDEVEIMGSQVLLQGTTLGTDLNLGFEYYIKPRWSINLGASFFQGKIKEIKATTSSTTNTITLEKENYENLSRLDLAAGITFYW